MPEGDTVWRTCHRLHEALAGRRLLASDLRWPGIATADLRGMTVVEVIPRGKHILVRLDSGWTVHSHLRMDGQWRIEPTDPSAVFPGAVPGTPASLGDGVRAVLVAPEWTAVGSRLGMLDLVRTSEEHTLIGHLGPDILDPDFEWPRAVTNLARSDAVVGAALLDQRILAGIGTMWASESLFLRRQHPWTPAAELSEAQLTALIVQARRLMTANLPFAVQSSTGSRRDGENTYVHARSGRPCRRCGATVRVAGIGPPTRERTMFYCPACQGGLAPTDDGRSVAPLGSSRRPRPAGGPAPRAGK